MTCNFEKMDKQRTCDVTVSHVRVITVAMEMQQMLNILCVCVCILALVILEGNHILSVQYYIVMYNLSGCTIFFHIISQRHDCY